MIIYAQILRKSTCTRFFSGTKTRFFRVFRVWVRVRVPDFFGFSGSSRVSGTNTQIYTRNPIFFGFQCMVLILFNSVLNLKMLFSRLLKNNLILHIDRFLKIASTFFFNVHISYKKKSYFNCLVWLNFVNFRFKFSLIFVNSQNKYIIFFISLIKTKENSISIKSH